MGVVGFQKPPTMLNGLRLRETPNLGLRRVGLKGWVNVQVARLTPRHLLPASPQMTALRCSSQNRSYKSLYASMHAKPWMGALPFARVSPKLETVHKLSCFGWTEDFHA